MFEKTKINKKRGRGLPILKTTQSKRLTGRKIKTSRERKKTVSGRLKKERETD